MQSLRHDKIEESRLRNSFDYARFEREGILARMNMLVILEPKSERLSSEDESIAEEPVSDAYC